MVLPETVTPKPVDGASPKRMSKSSPCPYHDIAIKTDIPDRDTYDKFRGVPFHDPDNVVTRGKTYQATDSPNEEVEDIFKRLGMVPVPPEEQGMHYVVYITKVDIRFSPVHYMPLSPMSPNSPRHLTRVCLCDVCIIGR